MAIPEKYRDLFTKRAFASLATLMPDGSPRVALAIIDPENPYRYLEIRGRVVEITEQGADAHIDKMAKKYLGADKYPYRKAGEQRVMYKIQPERTSMMG